MSNSNSRTSDLSYFLRRYPVTSHADFLLIQSILNATPCKPEATIAAIWHLARRAAQQDLKTARGWRAPPMSAPVTDFLILFIWLSCQAGSSLLLVSVVQRSSESELGVSVCLWCVVRHG